MPSPSPKTIAPSKIPEVKAFLKAKQALDDLRDLFPVAFKKLVELAVPYNATLTAADKAVRERECSSGPFDLYSYTRKYNAEALLAAVGRNKFPSMGGIIDEAPRYTIDKVRFEALVAEAKITPGLADVVIGYTPSFHKPDPVIIP
jgi:hypothetical protein